MAVEYPVDHIAHGAAQYAGQRGAKQRLFRVAAQQMQDQAGGAKRDRGEEPALPALSVGQEAEGGPWVVEQREIKEGQQVPALAIFQVAVEIYLGQLVRDDNDCGQQQPAGEPGQTAAWRAAVWPWGAACLRHTVAARPGRTGSPR